MLCSYVEIVSRILLLIRLYVYLAMSATYNSNNRYQVFIYVNSFFLVRYESLHQAITVGSPKYCNKKSRWTGAAVKKMGFLEISRKYLMKKPSELFVKLRRTKICMHRMFITPCLIYPYSHYIFNFVWQLSDRVFNSLPINQWALYFDKISVLDIASAVWIIKHHKTNHSIRCSYIESYFIFTYH